VKQRARRPAEGGEGRREGHAVVDNIFAKLTLPHPFRQPVPRQQVSRLPRGEQKAPDDADGKRNFQPRPLHFIF
jgi:hypothetical protein